MRNFALASAVVLSLLVLSGCGAISYITEKTFAMFTPPQKTRPSYSLGGKSILLLVDPATQEVSSRYPGMKFALAKTLAKELSDRKAARTIVNPRDMIAFAQSRPGFAHMSVAEIGAAFKVDQVVQIVVNDYYLEQTLAADSYAGRVSLAVRVVDVGAARQVYPDMGQGRMVEARSPSGIQAEGRSEAEKVLLGGLARKVSMLFVPYVVEKLPRGAEVQ